MDELNCKFDEYDKLEDEFDELDKLKDEFDELDKLNCKTIHTQLPKMLTNHLRIL